MIKDKLKGFCRKVFRWGWYIFASWLLVQICMYMNTYIDFAVRELRIFKYDILVSMFGAVIVAPLVEEYTKRLASKGRFLYVYAVLFGFFELAVYVSMGAPWVMRLPVVFVHLFFASVHHYFERKSKEEGNKYISWIGFLLAVLFHATYNFMVSLGSM